MNTPTILVTGATGNVGRPLVADLLAGGARVRALTRDPAAAGFPPGVAVAGGDYAAPGLLAEAVRGADAVFVNIGALREHVGELIAAARGAGVSTIVMLSSIAVRDEGDQVLSLGRQHKAVEDLLKALASYVRQTAYMTADLEKIIGRPATSYAQWAVQHADAYR